MGMRRVFQLACAVALAATASQLWLCLTVYFTNSYCYAPDFPSMAACRASCVDTPGSDPVPIFWLGFDGGYRHCDCRGGERSWTRVFWDPLTGSASGLFSVIFLWGGFREIVAASFVCGMNPYTQEGRPSGDFNEWLLVGTV